MAFYFEEFVLLTEPEWGKREEKGWKVQSKYD